MINLNTNSMTQEEEEEDDSDSQMKNDESDSIADYSTGLPSIDDLTPLSQSLIPFQLASAFKITAETPRTMSDVTRASNSTFSSLNFNPTTESDPKRIRPNSDNENDERNKSSSKRPRLVWTPQLHKRFVEVVGHLGLKNAVPKTIMQLMNVEGLTRENVASHLQKYRLYVKRMQENDDDDSAANPSDNLFASTPIPRFSSESYTTTTTNNNNNHVEMQMPMMGTGNGIYDGGNSLHHHHHYHHHYQQQYGGGGGTMGQQQNNYGNNAYSHHLAQK